MRWRALFIGVAGLAFGGCGKEQRSDERALFIVIVE